MSKILVRFAYFDNDVQVEEPLKQIPEVLEPEKFLLDFVITSTSKFFKFLGMSKDFFQIETSEWKQHNYRRNQKVTKSIKVLNDLVKQGVALIQEFNTSMTKNEEQKQFLCCLVEDHQKKFGEPTKAGAIKCSQT